MENSGLVWISDRLVAYLAGPQKMLPGIRLMFPGFGNPADAQDVVSYLFDLAGRSHARAHCGRMTHIRGNAALRRGYGPFTVGAESPME